MIKLPPLKIAEYAELMQKIFQREIFTVNFKAETPNAKFHFGTLNYVDSTQYNKELGIPRKTSAAVRLSDPKFLQDVETMQSLGYAVYILLQDSRQEPNDTPNKNIISKDFIEEELRFVCWDTDGAPYKDFYKILKAAGYPPHYWVVTSQGKRHAVIRLSDHIKPWQLLAFQRSLYNKYKGDKSLGKTAQQLRLPGSYHLKDPKNPQLVTLKIPLPDAPEPTLEELTEILDLDVDLKTPHRDPLPTLTPETRLSEGDRHPSLVSYIRQQAEHTIEPQTLFNFATGFIVNHFKDPQPFLNGGKRSHEVKRIISDCIKYANQAETERVVTLLSNNVDNRPSKPEKHPLTLPDSIYTTAPGLIGEITNHILKTTNVPLPPMAFLAALSIVSTIKGAIFKTPTGLKSNIYMIVVAESGGGKKYALDVVKDTLEQLGLGYRYCTSIRSEAGLKRHLQDNNGNLTFVRDEIGHWFDKLQSNKLAAHDMGIVDLILQLFSTGKSPIREGKLADEAKEQVIIKDPCFSIFGATTPIKLDSAFTPENIQEGLFSRWLIAGCPDYTPPITSNYPSTTSLPDPIIKKLQELNHSNLELEDTAKQITALRKELDSLEAIPKQAREMKKTLKDEGYSPQYIKEQTETLKLTDEEKERTATLGQQIKELHEKAVATANTEIVVTFSKEAEKLFEDYFWELQNIIKTLTLENNPLKAIYTRAREHAYKHALVVAAGDEITAAEATWAINYSRLSAKALFNFASERMGISRDYKIQEEIYSHIRELHAELTDPTEGITKESLRLKVRGLDANVRNAALAELKSLGRIDIKRAHKKSKPGPQPERIFLVN